MAPAPATTPEREKVKPPKLARRWGVHPDKIVYFILSGELRAIDASTKRDKRPRYLIDERDIEAFEKSRQVVPAPAASPPRRKRPATPAGFIRHFRDNQ
jgi:hypothetical protein